MSLASTAISKKEGSASGAPPGMLHLSLVGHMSVRFADQALDIRGRKARALLGYMALSETGIETRERLVGLCWSESEEAKARGSLRQALRELRQVFDAVGYNGLQADKIEIALEPTQVEVDILTAIREAEACRVHPLLLNTPRIADKLLQDLDDVDPSFRVWLLARRQTLGERLLRALESALAACASGEGERVAQAIINLDPTHEEACRHLMRCRAEAGDTAGALRAYKALWDLLDEEYDMEPSQQTRDLVAQIKQGNFEPAASTPPPSSSSSLSSASPAAAPAVTREAAAPQRRPPAQIVLSVEPFFMEGIHAEKMHLIYGFRHALIACLVRFREWRVTERPATPQVQGDQRGPGHYAIQATAFQIGDRVNVILTLKEIATELFVWSDRFELGIENWFEAQHNVVRRITMALNVHLSAERLMRLAAEPDVSLDLYDRWLRGQAMILNFHPEEWTRARGLFRSIIDEAPDFAPAYSSLVQLGNTAHIAQPGVFRSPSRQNETLGLARTAARLDPIDSRAQLCLGWAYAFDRQFENAALHFSLACDLNDHDPWTLISGAQAYAFMADFERARQLADQALEATLLPSLSHWGYHAGIRFFCGDYEGAYDAAVKSGDVLFSNRAWRAASLAHLGRLPEAREEAARCVERIRENWRGAKPPEDEEIGRWILDLFPIRRGEDEERLRRGLFDAGIRFPRAETRAGP
jgi:DNA-binding SARP family transcriptional activator/TolB-like protein